MQELIGKEVVVSANEIEYHGTLVEIGETEVHLEGETGWIVIPIGSVLDIRAAAE
jgi:hypothetical protein